MTLKPPKPEPTVVGIGASAGGLAAIRTFLDHVPANCGLAFVIVVHLSPDHESHLAELLQPHVHFPVQQVNETIALEPNNVYVIPPNANLSAIDTHLRLTKLEERRQERAPIDHFFRTLAAVHDGHAIAVVLTGTGSDGTLGVKDVKAHGGLVIVQDPNEAEFDGMPQSAIATGLVDFILPLAEIPATILRYEHTRPRVPVLAEGENIAPDEQILLQKIFTQLRARTNRDFSHYKRSTVLRRIARRMQINYLEDLSGYLERLRERPDEVVALADDLLITVTHFFRDTEVFEKLKKEVIPDLFSHKGAQESLRIWSVGCATGEEAYSLAVLLAEEAPRHQPSPQIQVFASDLHSRSLATAREGLYSGDIETDVSPERLKRFFERENGGFRIHKEIRDLVVFTPHNLLSDPPFSRLDLISCRNLLIYLERNIQHDVLDLFHYALKPEGVLLMGSAETIDGPDLFRVDDKRLCIFRKRNVPAREPRLPVFPLVRQRLPGENGEEPGSIPAPMSYGMLHLGMVEQYAPPSILIGPDNRLVHLSEHAGRYLIHPGGEPTASALKLVREELRIELQASLQMVREKRVPYDSRPLPVRFDGHARPVVMHVRPALEPEREDFVLVIFEEREPHDPEDGAEAQTSDSRDERIAELENELLLTRQRLQAMIEEYETRREEMKASTEEMQSTNEELRSTMEELETSKEELQSINEELQTVNQQNRHKVEELAQLSSDLQNHLAATDIATLFLDRELRILRFTPRLGDIFNARVTDRGRPISDLTHRLGYDDLRADAEAVLSRLVPIEREVQDDAGRWYLTRVLPYRSTQDRIEGVVITFVDIDSRKRTEESLRRSEERLRRMVNAGVIGVLTFDEFGMLIDSNETWLSMSGYTREEIGTRKLNRRILTPGEYLQISDRQMQKLAATGSSDSYEKEYFRRDGSRIWLICTAAKIDDRTVIEYCIDISDRKRAEQRARDARLVLRAVADGDLEVTKALSDEMYYCLGCLACQTACPAGVNYAELFETARAEVEQAQVNDGMQRNFWRWLSLNVIFMRPWLLRLIGRVLRLYQSTGLEKLMRKVHFFGLMPRSLSKLEPQTPQIAAQFSDDLIWPKESPREGQTYRVGLLTGCIQDLAFSNINRDTADVLLANSCEVITPRSQSCCGSLHAHNGELELARELARRQIDSFDLDELDAIITNAGGCGSHLKTYGHLLHDDPFYAAKAQMWDRKVKDVHEWLVQIRFRKPSAGAGVTEVTYHESCHLCHGQKVVSQPRQILASIPGLVFKELPESNWCCGSAGIYNITQPEQSQKLLDRKVANLRQAKAPVVATSNPGCHLQLANGLRSCGDHPCQEVTQPVTLLAQAYRAETNL